MIRKPVVLNTLPIGEGALDALVNQKADTPLEALDASIVLTIDGASSSATIRLPQGTKIDGRVYVKMFTVQGSAGVFRTRSPQAGYGDASTNLRLEHAVNELGDFIIPDKFEKLMTLKKAMQTIFGYYSNKSGLWTLGTVETPSDPDSDEDSAEQCVLDVDYDNCLEAIQSVMEQYPYMYLDFNFETRPFKLNVRNLPLIVQAEGRLARNVKSASVTTDDSELFTRVYMEGYAKNKDKNGVGYYTSNSSKKKYGLIETKISGANETAAIAERTVKNFMHVHKKPRYNITIEGTELSNITGETLDKLTISKLMRLALPKYKTTVLEHITQLSFPSVYKNPNAVTVTLNDEAEKVIKYIKKAQKTAAKAAKAAASVQKAYLVDATVKDQVLTLTKGDGTTVNFSKAVTLEGDWSGGRYTVKAKQKQVVNNKTVESVVKTISTKLNGIELQANKSPVAVNTYDLKIPLKVMYDNGLGTALGNKSNTEYAQDVTVSAKPVYDKGRNAVKIKPFEPNPVTGALPSYRTFTYKTDAPVPRDRSDTWYLVETSWSGYEKSVYLQSPSQVNYARKDVDARPVANAVEINAPTWANTPGETPPTNSNTATFKTNAPSPQQRTLPLYLSESGWDGNIKTVYLSHTNSLEANRIAKREIDATARWTAGWNAVTVGEPTAKDGEVGAHSTRSSIVIKATAANENSNQKTFTLTRTTYTTSGGETNHCVNMLEGSKVVGRIGTESVYNDGVDYGKTQLSWNIPSDCSHGSQEPTGTFDKYWLVSKNETWIWFTVSVNGQSKKFKIKLTT